MSRSPSKRSPPSSYYNGWAQIARLIREGKSFSEEDIPADLRDDADTWREAMLERLYGHSDDLMEMALRDEAIPSDAIRRVIRLTRLSRCRC